MDKKKRCVHFLVLFITFPTPSRTLPVNYSIFDQNLFHFMQFYAQDGIFANFLFNWMVELLCSKGKKSAVTASGHQIKFGEIFENYGVFIFIFYVETTKTVKSTKIIRIAVMLLKIVELHLHQVFLCSLNDLYVVYLLLWLFALVICQVLGGIAKQANKVLPANPCCGLNASHHMYTRNFPEDKQNVQIKWMYWKLAKQRQSWQQRRRRRRWNCLKCYCGVLPAYYIFFCSPQKMLWLNRCERCFCVWVSVWESIS